MNPLDTALSPAELDELDAFLASDDAPESAMDLSTLGGYLTAIVIGPQMVMPSHWLPWVWDREDGRAEAIYASIDQANRIMGLLMRFMNGIADAFMDDPASFAPIYWRAAQWVQRNGVKVSCLARSSLRMPGVCCGPASPRSRRHLSAWARTTAWRLRARPATPGSGWKRLDPPWSRFMPSGTNDEPVSCRG